MGLVKLTILDLRSKVPKIQGPGVGLAISPLVSLLLFLFLFLFCLFVFFFRGAGDVVFGAGGGRLYLLQVHLLMFLGHPFVFNLRAFFNPM